MKTQKELLELAKKEAPKEQRHLDLMPVIDVLRSEKEFTWAEITQWLAMNGAGQHSNSYWAQRWSVWRTQQKDAKLPVVRQRTNAHTQNDKLPEIGAPVND
jgi:hypothetical protein